jgi:ribonuclease T2
MDYCRVSGALQILDGERKWDELPAPKLSAETRTALEVAMPGTQSFLDRHEWVKHGTCYETNAEEYFTDSLAMLEAVNSSSVRDLFAGSVGSELTQEAIRAAFDAAFGPGAGERVRVACQRDGDRRIITELTIGLTGDIGASHQFAERLMDARPTDGGCDAGIVDPVGFQ